MDTELRRAPEWSEADARRVTRALAVAFLIRFVALPLVKWILLLVVIPTLVLFLLSAI